MSRLDEAIEFYNQVIQVGGWSIQQPRPTEETIRATEDALGFSFPPSFRRFIVKSRYYSSIAKDLNHPLSVVPLNKLFHEESIGHYLPNFLILFMGGHDGDCNCFDSRFRDESGEYPVVYWNAESMGEQDVEYLQPTHANFLEFLEFITAHQLKRL